MITSSPKLEPNRLERVAASAPGVTSAAAGADTPSVHLGPNAKAETTETAAPDRVIAMKPAPTSQLPAPPPRQLVMAKDDNAPQIDGAKKISESELGKPKEARTHRAERRAGARHERRQRQEIEAAANAVRKLQRDGTLQDVSQRNDSARFGFFGND